MPHHWKPAERDEPSEEIANCEYHGRDKDGHGWQLVPISDGRPKRLRKGSTRTTASEFSTPKAPISV
jgi:hypothetical protein